MGRGIPVPRDGVSGQATECGILSTVTDGDELSKYGPNGQAVAAILSRAATMTLAEMATVAASSGSVTGYLGRNRDWVSAQSAARGVAEAHSRTTAAEAAVDAAMDCVIAAIQRVVAADGKDSDVIADAWRKYRAALADDSPKRRHSALRKLQTALRHTVGLKSAKTVPIASGAASTAALVVGLWDLVGDEGSFSRTQRDLLLTPWTSAFSLPEELAD